ncbi:MAG: U3 snoRNP protein, partial [Marteilia pararefringens]
MKIDFKISTNSRTERQKYFFDHTNHFIVDFGINHWAGGVDRHRNSKLSNLICGSHCAMLFNFDLTNVLGGSYRQGNILFTPDNERLITSIGNMISVYDLKLGKSFIIDVGSLFPISHMCISPNGNILICFDSSGVLYVVNLISNKIVLSHNFMQPIQCAAFSNSGQFFAVARHNILQFFTAPTTTHAFNPFVPLQNFIAGRECIRTITWHSTDKVLAIGSDDNSIRIVNYSDEKAKLVANLSGNNGEIADIIFTDDNFDCISISKNSVICFWTCNNKSAKMVFKFEKKEYLSKFKEEEDVKSRLQSCCYNKPKGILILAFE